MLFYRVVKLIAYFTYYYLHANGLFTTPQLICLSRTRYFLKLRHTIKPALELEHDVLRLFTF